MENGRFRSAFSGFNRQDVLDFIERSSRESMQKLEDKQRTADLLQTENQTLSGELSSLKERLTELEAAAAITDQLQARADALTQERDALARRLQEAEARLNQIEPDFAQYEAVKTRLAEIELNAHSHAALIEQEAFDRTVKVGEQLSLTVQDVKKEYHELKTCSAEATTNFRSDLERILSALDRFSVFFGDVEDTLDHLLAETKAGIEAVSPDPFPPELPRPEEAVPPPAPEPAPEFSPAPYE